MRKLFVVVAALALLGLRAHGCHYYAPAIVAAPVVFAPQVYAAPLVAAPQIVQQPVQAVAAPQIVQQVVQPVQVQAVQVQAYAAPVLAVTSGYSGYTSGRAAVVFRQRFVSPVVVRPVVVRPTVRGRVFIRR